MSAEELGEPQLEFIDGVNYLFPARTQEILADNKIWDLEAQFIIGKPDEQLNEAEDTILTLLAEGKIEVVTSYLDADTLLKTTEMLRNVDRQTERKERPNILLNAFLKVAEWLNKTGAENLNLSVDLIFDKLVDSKIIPEEFIEKFDISVEGAGLASQFFKMLLIFIGMPNFIKSFMLSFLKIEEQNLNTKFRPSLPEIGSILQNYFKNPERRDEIKDIFRRYGIKEEHIKLVEDGLHTLLSTGEIQHLLYREQITEENAIERLQKLGYTEQDPHLIRELFKQIPNIQDIIRMAVREAWSEEAVALWGLDEDFPEEFAFWAEKQGYSKDWAVKYWRAHWQLVSPQLAFEMFHREQMTEDDLAKLLKFADYPINLRDKMIAVAYTPLTRVDIRRMHRVGVLNEQEVERRYRHIGFSPDDAKLMADFTVRFNEGDKLDLSKGQVLQGYKEGILPRETALDYLIVLNVRKPEAEYLLTIEDSKELARVRKIQLSNIEKRFKIHELDERKVRQEMAKLELPPNQQKALIEEWSIERRTKEKRPSLEILIKWVKVGLIEMSQFKDEMNMQGWSSEYIDLYVTSIETGVI